MWHNVPAAARGLSSYLHGMRLPFYQIAAPRPDCHARARHPAERAPAPAAFVAARVRAAPPRPRLRRRRVVRQCNAVSAPRRCKYGTNGSDALNCSEAFAGPLLLSLFGRPFCLAQRPRPSCVQPAPPRRGVCVMNVSVSLVEQYTTLLGHAHTHQWVAAASSPVEAARHSGPAAAKLVKRAGSRPLLHAATEFQSHHPTTALGAQPAFHIHAQYDRTCGLITQCDRAPGCPWHDWRWWWRWRWAL